jgi:NTP pyrophosphatase (non-canonical NTP hydrolase)
VIAITKRCVDWVVTTLGPRIASDMVERGMRTLEESVELAQSLGVPEKAALSIVDRVYSKPVGDARQEAAGVYFTLIVLAAAGGIDLEEELVRELERVEDPAMRAKIRGKHALKFSLGIGLPLEDGPECPYCPKGFDGLRPRTGRREHVVGTYVWWCPVHGPVA